MIRTAILSTALLFAASSAIAGPEDHADHKDHQHHKTHDHGDAHAGHDMSEMKAKDAKAPTLSVTPEIAAALEKGGEAAVVEVLGVVCDFCATAMNKTFGKREEVAAVYVDLDTKTLSIVFEPNANLDDETIDKLVTKAGYRIAAIHRGDDVVKGLHDAADHS